MTIDMPYPHFPSFGGAHDKAPIPANKDGLHAIEGYSSLQFPDADHFIPGRQGYFFGSKLAKSRSKPKNCFFTIPILGNIALSPYCPLPFFAFQGITGVIVSMKTIRPYLLSLAWCLIGLPLLPNAIANNYEEALRVHLNHLLGSQSFSLQTLDVQTGDKSVRGTGTFFGTKGVDFAFRYDDTDQQGQFEATLPSNAKVQVSNRSLQKLAGQKLQKLLPDAFAKSVYLEKFSFTVNKENKQIGNLSLWFNGLRNWELLEGTSFSLEQIKVNFSIDHPTQKAKRRLMGILTGITQLGSKPLTLSGKIADKKENLQLSADTEGLELKSTLQSLAGKAGIKGLKMPNSLIKLALQDGLFTIAPYQKWATLDAHSNLGKTAIYVSKNLGKSKREKKKIQYLVKITTPDDFKLSKLNQKLKALDRLPLGGQTIVLSSAEKSKKETSGIPSLAQLKSGIQKGCNYVAKLDLSKISLDKLIGIKHIVVNSALSDKLQDVVLESALDTDLSIGQSNKLKNVLFRLQPSPHNFAISLLGVMDAQINDDQLQFKGGIELVLSDQSLNFLAMMKGDWRNPMGTKGLVMSNVAMQMGASFTTAPVLLPNVALTGELQIGSFKGAAALAFDTRNPAKSMIAASFNRIELDDIFKIVVDRKTQQKIPKGIQEALAKVFFEDMEFQIVPQPIQVVDVKYDPGFRAAGKVSILGVSGEGRVEIDHTNGILLQGAIDPIDIGPFQLRGAGRNARPGLLADLRVGKTAKIALNGKVSLLGLSAHTDVSILANGFRFKVGGKVFDVFQGDITASGQALSQGGNMYLKVKMKTDIWNFLDEKLTGFIEEGTSNAVRKLSTKQQDILAAEKKVEGWDKEIRRLREKVKDEQAADRAKYQKAYDDVERQQAKVNGLNKKIDALKKEIKSKNKITEAHKIIALQAKLKPLQIAKGTAWTALEGYQLVLKGLKKGNSDPDLNPKVIAAKSSRLAALGGLKTARGSLEALKFTLGVTGKTASFIIDKGTDALVKIHAAEFEGKLDAVKGGAVKLDLDIEWMGKRKNMDLSFNFHNPVSNLKAFADRLMKGD